MADAAKPLTNGVPFSSRPFTIKLSPRRCNAVLSVARRRAAWTPPQPRAERGYGAIFSQHVGQANEGCDFDVLGPSGPLIEPDIH